MNELYSQSRARERRVLPSFALLICLSVSLAPAQDDETEPSPESPTPREMLQARIDTVLGQQETAQQSRAEAEQRSEDRQTELERFRQSGLDHDPPYPLSMLDGLRDELAVARQRLEAVTIVTLSANEAMEAARTQFEQRDQARRLAQEAAEAVQDPERRIETQQSLALAELESTLAEETLELRRIEAADAEFGQQAQQAVIALLEDKIASIAGRVEFTKSELSERLTEVREKESRLNREVRTAELNQEYNEKQWLSARAAFESATDDRELARESLEAERLARLMSQEKLSILKRQLERQSEVRQLWDRRFAIHNDPPPADTRLDWEADFSATMEQLDRDRLLRTHQVAQVREELTTLDRKIENVADDPELVRRLERQRTRLDELLALYDSALLDIEGIHRLHENVMAELRGESGFFSLDRWVTGIRRALRSAWHYELATVDDRSITVGKSITGLAFVLLGFIVSSLVSRMLERRLRRRSKMNKDAAAAIRTLVFYLLVIFFTLFALNVANVPLTAFTVLGGALAIGVGLGSQSIVNNFFSGLFIMAERPIRLGERVVHGGYDGIVEEIGFRGTKIRTLTGHLVTVPNSNLINESVENIGRRPYIRRTFHLRLRLDTPGEKLSQAVAIVRDILEEPDLREPIHCQVGGDDFPPRVYFNEINPDSFNILCIYWFCPPAYWDFLEHSQRVNLRIATALEQAGIALALPTQTIRLEGDESTSSGSTA